MVTVSDIIKCNKFRNADIIYLIACISIPFFRDFTIEKQSKIINQSERTIIRTRNYLEQFNIINKTIKENGNLDFIQLKKVLS